MKTIQLPEFSNIPAEQSLLASLLIDNKAIYDIEDKLKPEHFHVKEHADIFKEIMRRHSENKGVDFIALLDANFSQKYVEDLASMVTTSMHTHSYADSIIEAYIKRTYIDLTSEIIENSKNTTASELTLLVESKILDAGKDIETGGTRHISDVALELMRDFEINLAKPPEEKIAMGILSGLQGLDILTKGFKKGKVYLAAGRPSSGKSALLTTMVDYIAVDSKIPVAVYSLEMDDKEMLYRIIAKRTKIDCADIELGDVNDIEAGKVYEEVSTISSSPFYINKRSDLNIASIRSNLKRMIAEHGVQIAFIDYLGLIQGDGKDSYHKVTKISNDLMRMAKDLNIPVVALCQLSRAIEQRGQKNQEATNADLRDSGSLEQDAYCIFFIDREELRSDDPLVKGKATIKVTKNRGGRIGKSNYKYIGKCFTFEDDY